MIARDCVDAVLSPHLDSTSSPLLGAIDAIDDRETLTVADLGCGSGPLLPSLLDRFGRVVAVDSSAGMRELAERRVREHYGGRPAHLELRSGDLTRLRYAQRFDVVVTLNSVIMAELAGRRRALRGVHRSLVPGGIYLAVFPAIESLSEAYRFCYDVERRRGQSHRDAWARVRRRLGARRMNFALGLMDTGLLLQKYYAEDELRGLLRDVGFSSPVFGRVIYAHELSYEGVVGYGAARPPIWHWFVRCEKELPGRG